MFNIHKSCCRKVYVIFKIGKELRVGDVLHTVVSSSKMQNKIRKKNLLKCDCLQYYGAVENIRERRKVCGHLMRYSDF